MRDYMKRVYGIDVLTIRSFVEQQKVTRERKFNKPGYGPLRRPKSKKKMTIEMTEPFVWPEPPKAEENSDDEYVFLVQVHFIQLVLGETVLLTFYDRWSKKEFYDSDKFQSDLQKEFSGQNDMKAPETRREAYEKQAKDLLEGKTTWRPTWQALGLQYERAALKKFAVKKGAEAGTKSSPAVSTAAGTTADATAASPAESPSKDSPSSTNS